MKSNCGSCRWIRGIVLSFSLWSGAVGEGTAADVPAGDVGFNEIWTAEAPRPKALAILREMLQTQIDQAYDSSAERFLSDKLSPQCSLKLLEFVHALQNFKPGTLRLDPQQFNSTLNLVTQNYENGTVDLIWLPDEAPFNDSQDNISLHHNNIVHITLAGYSLTLKSAEETVKTTLEASTKKHRLTLLKPWTEYEVILRPFYTKTGKTNEKYKIGKASTTKFRFPAAVNPQQFNSTLNLVTQKYENGTVDLIWLPDEAPFNDSQDNISWHYNNSVHITLAGYFLTLKSAEETVKTTLEASTKKHRFTSLKPWTEYEVILRPFYTKTGKTNEKYKIGKASTTKFRSPAAAQPRPVDVKAYFWGLSPREVYLNVSDSPNRHGERFGHRVRWKLHGDGTSVDGDGQADFGIDGTYFETENWLHINLPPGRLYTLYISALNKGLNDTVIAGEELEIEVATVPPEPADVDALSMGPRSVNVIWRSVGFADIFLVAVCNGSCPPLSREFVPSLHASYLLTYVHGSLEEQIREMYESLQINYVLVKVDGSGEESKESNVLIETPFLLTNPSVSMASCYMGKCSHAVTKMVSKVKNTPPRPINVEFFFKERGGMSLEITDPENRNGEGAGHRVRWKLHGGSTDGDGQADFGYSRLISFDKERNRVDLSLEPGRYYTLYISALNKGENNTVIVGPEISTEVTTVPHEPIEVSAESMGRKKVYVNWRSVGSADIFLVALCNGSCPPLSQDFFPSLHASYLLTNVHGPVKEQINRMSKRLHMDYILVKVKRGREESSLHNIIMELPDSITNPTVSVACCRIDKCSPSVSTMVKTKKEGLRAPTEVKVAPVSKEKALVSWTEPDEPMISRLGYIVTWLCQPGHHKKTVLVYSRSAQIDFPPGTTCQVLVASFGRMPDGKLLRSVLVEGV